MHVGETALGAVVVAPGEVFVIQAQLAQLGGVEVVHVEFVHDGTVAPFVGLAVSVSGFESASGPGESGHRHGTRELCAGVAGHSADPGERRTHHSRIGG